MQPARIIEQIKLGQEPSAADLREFALGLANGQVSDAQAGAFAMAVCLQGISEPARVALTQSMRDSGDVMRWDLPGPVLDKHSTGGVGDCISLVLGPALAACDVFVPMVSGRGLGHTGGTLDKLEAITGVDTRISQGRFREMTRDIGCAIVSAGPNLAPADRRLYAVRDVTGTVESIDLITASILSKKLAAGLDGLVLDVKCGSGAFMRDLPEAKALAEALVSTANGAGCRSSALITRMDGPIAPAMGNALEVAASMEVLTGQVQGPVLELTLGLGERLLERAGIIDARARLVRAIESGEAAERFTRMIHALGGPPDMAQNWRKSIPEAAVVRDVPAPKSGYVSAIDGRALGHGVIALGGGRRREDDQLNYAVGYDQMSKAGDFVAQGAPLARVHAATPDAADAGAQTLSRAYEISDKPYEPGALILAGVE